MIDGAATTTLCTLCGLETIYRFMRPFVVRGRLHAHACAPLLFLQWIDSPKCAPMQRSPKKCLSIRISWNIVAITSLAIRYWAREKRFKMYRHTGLFKWSEWAVLGRATTEKPRANIPNSIFRATADNLCKRYLWLFSWDWVLNWRTVAYGYV